MAVGNTGNSVAPGAQLGTMEKKKREAYEMRQNKRARWGLLLALCMTLLLVTPALAGVTDVTGGSKTTVNTVVRNNYTDTHEKKTFALTGKTTTFEGAAGCFGAESGTLTVGFIGLAETLVALTGKHHGESEESQKLGLRIVEHMRKRCDDEAAKTHLNFTLIATPAEGLSGRFVALDRKKYGVIKGVTDREYYTNSFHVPVYFPIKAFRKIELEAPYHSFTNAGHITYVELDGDTCKNLEAFETIIRFMHDKGVGYGSINHPLDRDPVCGYVGVINGQCPRCGRKEGEAVSQETLKMLRRKYPHMPNCCR